MVKLLLFFYSRWAQTDPFFNKLFPLSSLLSPLTPLRVRLVGGVEKWNDGKLWEDGKMGGWKIFSFPSCVFGWRDGKVGGWKTLLFG